MPMLKAEERGQAFGAAVELLLPGPSALMELLVNVRPGRQQVVWLSASWPVVQEGLMG